MYLRAFICYRLLICLQTSGEKGEKTPEPPPGTPVELTGGEREGGLEMDELSRKLNDLAVRREGNDS